MSQWAQKLFAGEIATPEDWIAYLKVAHQKASSMTPKAFAEFRTPDGKNSYQILAGFLENFKPRPKRILDLACGDGHLVPFIQKSLNRDTTIVGVDMSEHELAVAKSKIFGANVSFKCEMADQMSGDAGSYDAILCHMALMLINPIEPVINEVHRVLRPEGIFAAVIGSEPASKGFFAVFRKTLMELIRQKHPKFGTPFTGDTRVSSQHQVGEIFPKNKFKNLSQFDFNLTMAIGQENVWSFFEDMYIVTALSPEDQAELKNRVQIAAKKFGGASGQVTLDLPIKLLSCVRI